MFKDNIISKQDNWFPYSTLDALIWDHAWKEHTNIPKHKPIMPLDTNCASIKQKENQDHARNTNWM